MEQTILTNAQKKVIAAVSQEPNLTAVYLSGGTALAAYYLNHRISDDLDFFYFEKIEKIFLHSFTENLKSLIGADVLRFERLYDRDQFFFKFGHEELKVEFSNYPFRQLEKTILMDGMQIDSLRDIAANKLMALLDRFDPKDFVDLYFIFKKFTLADVRDDVEKKFGIKIDDIFLGGELAKVKRIEALPKMIKKITIEGLKIFFAERAKELTPNLFE